ncbi:MULTISPECIES: transporter substrate-binding domain-containing protein [Psychrilyobacter]|uniref:Amino acid ABC transporter substrate-binding protein n=1 Tax=Psychrilyobacter piezotolerans TaxID=2293438 RepID=A0ABX9KJ75_9FUSO|nr:MULTISPECIES: transporter substrate-binding domain-containing protein [Psychrilyobacter]MCS5421133.1 transporter substrate-binding domain-containing protein [Psychrilyobacter sp. S5]NDI77095.1 transporter substrate-binding domain-containing protein [Psychrilyobacter piezotolerans]RDE64095.1 amino acid ABC transporter substrate-binding protein [Psychrilyobacter sp. S5]REI42187.1 amino acid ABC transporter substrate-binding protein [Psychrilyobacter piezotolerans]
MKKIFLKTLAVILLLFLMACSKEQTETLRVGMDLKFYPFTGSDNNGNPSGIEIDIAEALGEYLGKNVEIVNTEFSMLIPALQRKEIDIIIGSMSITEEREKTVDFSNPYLYGKIVALVNKEFADFHDITNDMPIEKFFNIKNTNFIGINGSIAVSIPQSYGYEVKSITSDAVAEREVVTGNSDALVGSYTLYGMHATNKDTTIMYKNPIEFSLTGMAVKQGNAELLKKVNEFIEKMESSGLNNQLRKDWDQAIKEKLYDDNMTLDYYLSPGQ